MITMTVEGQLTMSNEVPCRAPIVVQFNYDPVDNPFAVDMLFLAEDGDEISEWRIDVDLLHEGSRNLADHSGLGDVKIKAYPTGHIGICLQSPDGHAHMGIPGFPVRDFLRKVGAETIPSSRVEEKIDDLIAGILDA